MIDMVQTAQARDRFDLFSVPVMLDTQEQTGGGGLARVFQAASRQRAGPGEGCAGVTSAMTVASDSCLGGGVKT